MFGGDPAKVTIAGESAGAISIGTLLSMPLAAGLYRRAIMQSGAAHRVIDSETARRVARRPGSARRRRGRCRRRTFDRGHGGDSAEPAPRRVDGAQGRAHDRAGSGAVGARRGGELPALATRGRWRRHSRAADRSTRGGRRPRDRCHGRLQHRRLADVPRARRRHRSRQRRRPPRPGGRTGLHRTRLLRHPGGGCARGISRPGSGRASR